MFYSMGMLDEIKIFHIQHANKFSKVDLLYLWIENLIKKSVIDIDYIIYFLENKNWNLKSFLFKLYHSKKCTNKFLIYIEEKMHLTFLNGYDELNNFIMTSESFDKETTEKILLYLICCAILSDGYDVLYELENAINMKTTFNRTTYDEQLYNLSVYYLYVPAFIVNFVLCEEFSEEDNDFYASDGVFIETEKYNILIECLNSIVEVNDDEITKFFIDKIKKEVL